MPIIPWRRFCPPVTVCVCMCVYLCLVVFLFLYPAPPSAFCLYPSLAHTRNAKSPHYSKPCWFLGSAAVTLRAYAPPDPQDRTSSPCWAGRGKREGACCS